MNKKLIFLTVTLLYLPVIAKVGCMDTSDHLKQMYDNKELRYVQCNCPCEKYQAQGLHADKGDKCLACGHIHDPQPLIVLQKEDLKSANKNTTNKQASIPTIKDVINRFKQSKK